MQDIFAIVGSEHWPGPSWESVVKDLIRERLRTRRPDLVISGGAGGVDSWAIQVARELDIDFKEFPPKHRRWAPDGFEDRNMVIAQTCNRMLAIRSKSSRRYGTRWTANYAEGIGRPVERITL